jgi:transcriptional regulator with XRE-family HTH domain
MGDTTTLGERLRQLRTGKRWTLDQLAQEAGVSKGLLSGIENGHNQPSGKVALKLANALGASVDYLLQGGAEPAPGPAKSVEVPKELVALAEARNWSFPKVRALLDARDAVVARRSDQPRRPFTTKDWEELAERLAPYLDDKDK